ncbi:MAG: hypothetical protein DMF99_30165 [Acidobacteria bacterium]|nr:MAG: hypothetical protein DMF99_30165 [Acidobacteriota bacterium]
MKRTAGRAAELILFQRGLRLARRREDVPRLQRIVAVELPRRPVQLVASRFRDDVDDGAGVAAELGGVRVRFDLEFNRDDALQARNVFAPLEAARPRPE